MKIAVVSGKGGVGKTTIACGLASMLSKNSDTVLLDLDPQGNATWGLGGNLNSPGAYYLLTHRDPDYQSVAENLSVISASQDLLSHEVQRLNAESLYDRLNDINKNDNSHWVFDCPPGNEHLERLAVVAADVTLIIVDAHPYAIQGARRVMYELRDRKERDRLGSKKWALVMSRIDSRRAIDKALPRLLEKQFPDIHQLTVRQDTPLAAATIDRTPLLDHTKKCRGITDLENVCGWVLNG